MKEWRFLTQSYALISSKITQGSKVNWRPDDWIMETLVQLFQFHLSIKHLTTRRKRLFCFLCVNWTEMRRVSQSRARLSLRIGADFATMDQSPVHTERVWKQNQKRYRMVLDLRLKAFLLPFGVRFTHQLNLFQVMSLSRSQFITVNVSLIRI